VWRQSTRNLTTETARIDADGSLVPTTGECKQGMDLSHKGVWGYLNKRLVSEDTAEFEHQPARAKRSYRVKPLTHHPRTQCPLQNPIPRPAHRCRYLRPLPTPTPNARSAFRLSLDWGLVSRSRPHAVHGSSVTRFEGCEWTWALARGGGAP